MAVLSNRSATADARRATKQSLLASTVALLDAGHAYADLSIEQIVRGAGVSRPTFYSYFQDKRALVLELAAGVREALLEGAEPWLAATDDDAERSLQALLQAYQASASTIRAIMEAATYDDDVAAFWRVLHDGFLPRVEERILADDPEMPAEDVAARAYSLIWMTERTLSEHTARPTVDEAALLRQLAWIWANSTSNASA